MYILKGEFLKIKRIWGLNIYYIFPLLITVVSTYETIRKVELYHIAASISPISTFYFQFFITFSPIAILLIIFSLIQIESKDKMWESTLLLPVPRFKIYIGKHIVSIFLVVLYVVASYILYVVSYEIYRAFFPQLSQFSYSDHHILLNFFSRMFLCLVLYTVIAIPIFIYIDNVIVSLGVLTFAILLSLFLTHQKWYIYYPFSYHITVLNTFKSRYIISQDKSIPVIILYIIIAFSIGLALFKKFNPK